MSYVHFSEQLNLAAAISYVDVHSKHDAINKYFIRERNELLLYLPVCSEIYSFNLSHKILFVLYEFHSIHKVKSTQRIEDAVENFI